MPQNNQSNPCKSTLHRAGDGFEAAGEGISQSGLAIAVLGAPGGPEGVAPGLVIARAGGAASTIGQIAQDLAFNRPRGEIVLRAVLNAAGARTVMNIVPSSVRSKLGDALAETAVGKAAAKAVNWLDPQRCPR